MCLSLSNTSPHPVGKTKHKQPDREYLTTYNKQITKNTHPVDEKSLCELDDLQSDQQADGDQVVVQDDECQQVICKVSGDVTCKNHTIFTYSFTFGLRK